MDLWSLLSIIAPGLFTDPAAFAERLPASDRVRHRPGGAGRGCTGGCVR